MRRQIEAFEEVLDMVHWVGKRKVRGVGRYADGLFGLCGQSHLRKRRHFASKLHRASNGEFRMANDLARVVDDLCGRIRANKRELALCDVDVEHEVDVCDDRETARRKETGPWVWLAIIGVAGRQCWRDARHAGTEGIGWAGVRAYVMLADSMATTISFVSGSSEARSEILSVCTTSSEYLASRSAPNNDPSPDIVLLGFFGSCFSTLLESSAG